MSAPPGIVGESGKVFEILRQERDHTLKLGMLKEALPGVVFRFLSDLRQPLNEFLLLGQA